MISDMRLRIESFSLSEFREYLIAKESTEATIQKYINDTKRFFEFLGERREVDKLCLMEYKEWLLARYTVSSVNSMIAALNQYLKFLGAEGLKLKRIRIQKPLFLNEEKEMSAEEYKKLVQTALHCGKDQLALCMETIAVTGIRISELRYFTVENVRKGRIEIYNKGKYRRIFLPSWICSKLLYFCSVNDISGGCIFITRNGKPKDRSDLLKEMKALKEDSGIAEEKIFPHNFRHLFAREYYRCTGDIAGLADLLGHSSLNVTRIYTANTGEIYQRQLDALKTLEIEGYN